MAQRIKIEQMLENLINNDSARAEELFHEYIVEKSREIYEGLLEADFDEETEMSDEKTDDFMSDVESEEDEFGGGEEESEEGEESEEDEFGGGEEEAPHSEESEGETFEEMKDTLEQILQTLQDALPSANPEGPSEFSTPMSDSGESFEFEDFDDLETVREYVEKVGEPYKGGKVAGSTEHDVNKKSIVDNMKNDMGGTTANMVHGGEDGGKHDAPGAYSNKSKEDNAGNVNVPGAKKAATLSAVSGGHGTEKKGKGEESGVNKASLFRK